MHTQQKHTGVQNFNFAARVLHWLMAVLILAMLFIGVGMMSSLSLRPWLIDLHRPLGIAILLLAILRLGNGGACLASIALHADALPATARLGDALCRQLACHHVRGLEPSTNCSSQLRALRLVSGRTRAIRLASVSACIRTSLRSADTCLDIPRRRLLQHHA